MIFLLIIGIIFIIISIMQITGTQYSMGFANGSLLIGSMLIILYFLFK